MLKQEQWLSECYENLAKFVSSRHLHEQSPLEYDVDVSQRIYNYWKWKREKKNHLPLITQIDFVLEQRENAELLLAQINYSLKIRYKVRQVRFILGFLMTHSTFYSSVLFSVTRLFSINIVCAVLCLDVE